MITILLKYWNFHDGALHSQLTAISIVLSNKGNLKNSCINAFYLSFIDHKLLPIPDYQTIMLPLLKYASDRAEHSSKEAVEALAGIFQLSGEEMKRLLPSGKLPFFYGRVHWALSYLKGAGLLIATRRAYFRITERGPKLLEQNIQRIDNKFLKQFPEFVDYIGAWKAEKNQVVDDNSEQKGAAEIETTLTSTKKTPEEILDESYFIIRKDLAQELLTQVKSSSPEFF
jgi:restriction system protein